VHVGAPARRHLPWSAANRSEAFRGSMPGIAITTCSFCHAFCHALSVMLFLFMLSVMRFLSCSFCKCGLASPAVGLESPLIYCSSFRGSGLSSAEKTATGVRCCLVEPIPKRPGNFFLHGIDSGSEQGERSGSSSAEQMQKVCFAVLTSSIPMQPADSPSWGRCWVRRRRRWGRA